jgi:hypothetical protein
MDKLSATPARRRAGWVLALGLGLVFFGQGAWAAGSHPAVGIQGATPPVFSEDFQTVARLPDFNALSAGLGGVPGAALTPRGTQARWNGCVLNLTASLPPSGRALTLALLGVVTIGLGVGCGVAGAKRVPTGQTPLPGRQLRLISRPPRRFLHVINR